MKRVIWVVLFSLFFSSLSAHATPNPKPGVQCAKQGIKKDYRGKTYTCIKSGKKFVWNKGVVGKQGAPTPSSSTDSQPKEIFIPWSTKFSTQVMSDKAFDSFANWRKGLSVNQKNHQLLIQPFPNGNAPTLIQVLTAMDDIASASFSQFMKAKSVTVLGYEQQWVVSQINGTGGHLRNMQGKCDESTNLLIMFV